MCLIVITWQVIDNHPCIAAANRDEYYNRPSAPAAWWSDCPQVYAPRDLKAGGTWMGVAKLNGAGHKFAAITNVRDGSKVLEQAPSRGQLVEDFLCGSDSVQEYLQAIRSKAGQYNGFNLLLGELSPTRQELCWFSNRNSDHPQNGQLLMPGIYGLSNGALDAPWPKISKTKAQLASLLCKRAPQEAYFEMLSDTLPAPDHRLPDTGVSLELERLLSSPCIRSDLYGTRCSTMLTMNDRFEFEYHERLIV